jgi:hypothetical protein
MLELKQARANRRNVGVSRLSLQSSDPTWSPATLARSFILLSTSDTVAMRRRRSAAPSARVPGLAPSRARRSSRRSRSARASPASVRSRLPAGLAVAGEACWHVHVDTRGAMLVRHPCHHRQITRVMAGMASDHGQEAKIGLRTLSWCSGLVARPPRRTSTPCGMLDC